MKKDIKLMHPIADFLKYFLHIHQLNDIFIFTLSKYEKQIDSLVNANRVINEVENDEAFDSIKYKEKFSENIEAANKEVSDNYFSVKSSELVLLYSRFESAISEVIYLFFQKTNYKLLPSLDNTKTNLLDLLNMNKKDQKEYLADIYIQQKTLGIKYGFNRFEVILEPLFGKSNIEDEIKQHIYLFAQIRNLLIHKNGIIDKQFKNIIKNSKQVIGKKIQLDNKLMNYCISAIVKYAAEMINRIKTIA